MNTNTVKIIGILLVIVGLSGSGYILFTQRQGVTLSNAQQISEDYLESQRNDDLFIAEIMEFQYNFYIVYSEESTNIGAFEMLIDKTTGQIIPEYGPNMMWNLKYGHRGMMRGNTWDGFKGEAISEEDALELAQNFLDEVYPGSSADDAHPFYGYYTIHTLRDGTIFGMLSVNSYSGQVWYHSWHGDYTGSP